MAENQRKADGRGGWRPGSGRKQESLSAARMQELLDEVREREKAEGKTVFSIMLDEVFSKRKTRLTAAKYVIDKTTIPVTEGGDSDRNLAPGVYLPEQRPHLESVKDETEAA